MKKSIVLIFCLVLTNSCQKNTKPNTLDVGDIVFDPKLDDPDFEVCDENNIKQYYVRWSNDNPAGYIGEKRAITDHFFNGYKLTENAQSGYLTIRFVVNCKGKVGRLRIQEMDFEYREMMFDDKIKSQLLTLTKELEDWIPVSFENKKYDFYQYLTFKMINGQIVEILP